MRLSTFGGAYKLFIYNDSFPGHHCFEVLGKISFLETTTSI